MVAKKMTILMLLCALLLPAAALAAGAAANVAANSPPPPFDPANNYTNSEQVPEWVFFSACTAGDMSTLKAKVMGNRDLVRLRLPDGKTGLHLAAMAAKPEAAQFLMNMGADVNARDMYDKTPLYYATNHCHDRRVAGLLRERGGKIQPTKLYYGDGMYTLYRNCAYLTCPTCYWESVGGYPEGTTLPGARPPAGVLMRPSDGAAAGNRPLPPGAPAMPPPVAAPAAPPDEEEAAAPAPRAPAPKAPAASAPAPKAPAAAAPAPKAPAPKAPAPKAPPKGGTQTEE